MEDYYDTHSPLDTNPHPKAEKVVVARRPKDNPITIRLDSVTRAKLKDLAARRGLGPSTFAREIIQSLVDQDQSVLSVTILAKGTVVKLAGTPVRLLLDTPVGTTSYEGESK